MSTSICPRFLLSDIEFYNANDILSEVFGTSILEEGNQVEFYKKTLNGEIASVISKWVDDQDAVFCKVEKFDITDDFLMRLAAEHNKNTVVYQIMRGDDDL